MSAKTKIIVLKSKELLYTGIFLILGILLILLFVNMFSGGKSAPTSAGVVRSDDDALYIPGVYRSCLQLGDNTVELSVTVDADRINSISFVHLPDAVSTMYPLLETAMTNLSEQIVADQSLEVSYTSQTRYTSQALLSAIQNALKPARLAE